jgi:hypothetical protein
MGITLVFTLYALKYKVCKMRRQKISKETTTSSVFEKKNKSGADYHKSIRCPNYEKIFEG